MLSPNRYLCRVIIFIIHSYISYPIFHFIIPTDEGNKGGTGREPPFTLESYIISIEQMHIPYATFIMVITDLWAFRSILIMVCYSEAR